MLKGVLSKKRAKLIIMSLVTILGLTAFTNPASAFFMYATLSPGNLTISKGTTLWFDLSWGGEIGSYDVTMNCGNGSRITNPFSGPGSTTMPCTYGSTGTYYASVTAYSKTTGQIASDTSRIYVVIPE
ncbi:hypothetical protein [Paucisalibacillus globulus]|uniref:hypothetical protein n=1 Tax=Paucisalibacillus globulus TaxID=351095 RepID=UPI000BB73E23|nr:hypothetical protein [Paucisalibacillus globulus]